MNFYFRTEDIREDEILSLLVESPLDTEIIELLEDHSPVVLEGSRGTGKSFLMKSAYAKLKADFTNRKILPVYVSFQRSSLIHTNDQYQFQNWMTLKLMRELRKELLRKGVSSTPSILLPEGEASKQLDTELEKLIKVYETSYDKITEESDYIRSGKIPKLEDLKDTLEEICKSWGVKRVCIFFDEAVHVFRPEQQRQFFTFFKDLRSPYISCNAAVYPGVTHYGPSFELNHDAKFCRIERKISDPQYLKNMQEMVARQLQATEEQKSKEIFSENKDLFNTLIFAAGGNPRLLMKTLDRCKKTFRTKSVESVIKQFYGNDIWAEHTALGEKYLSYKKIVDWGRDFVEENVIPRLQSMNRSGISGEKSRQESTITFWVHKDIPNIAREALRLLTYTGVVRKLDDGSRTHDGIGTRYEVKYGCVIAIDANPHNTSKSLHPYLTMRRYVHFGMSHESFTDSTLLATNWEELANNLEEELLSNIHKRLDMGIDSLDLTKWQKEKLHQSGIETIQDLLNSTEDQLRTINQIGEKRARIIKNSAIAALLEYLAG
jgi:hypothetical protein